MLIFLKLQLIQTQSISEWRHSWTVSVHFVVIYNLSQNFTMLILLYEMTLNTPDIGSSNLPIHMFLNMFYLILLLIARLRRNPQLILYQYFWDHREDNWYQRLLLLETVVVFQCIHDIHDCCTDKLMLYKFPLTVTFSLVPRIQRKKYHAQYEPIQTQPVFHIVEWLDLGTRVL